MYTITFANSKGGCSKTTSALAIGQGMVREGLSVLYIDLDPQGNLTRALAQGQTGPTIYDVLHTNRPMASIIRKTDNAYIIAADERLASDNVNEQADLRKLRNRLSAVKNNYDVTIIDTQPGISMTTMFSLFAADGVLVPVTCDRFAVDGLRSFYKTISQTRKARTAAGIQEGLDLLGVIVSMYNVRTVLHRDVMDVLIDQAAQMNTVILQPPIRRTVAAAEWTFTGNVYENPNTTAAQDYLCITKEIISLIRLKKTAQNGAYTPMK